jgi:hypothetical protein
MIFHHGGTANIATDFADEHGFVNLCDHDGYSGLREASEQFAELFLPEQSSSKNPSG